MSDGGSGTEDVAEADEATDSSRRLLDMRGSEPLLASDQATGVLRRLK